MLFFETAFNNSLHGRADLACGPSLLALGCDVSGDQRAVTLALLEFHLTVSYSVTTTTIIIIIIIIGRDSSVGITTRYVLDGLEIESRCGRDFLRLSKPTLGPTQPPI